MLSALRIQTTVLPGQRIEVAVPELPEGCVVELIIVVSEETANALDEDAQPAGSASKYPPALMEEYRTLTAKKLAHGLTEAQAERLQAVRNEIAAIDRQQSVPDLW